jgi:hypothetical protein
MAASTQDAEALRPADEIAEVPLGLERVQAFPRAHLCEGQRRARELADREQVEEMRAQLTAGGETPLECIVAQLLGGREAGAAVGGERREVFVAHGGNLGAVIGCDLILPHGLVAGITVAVFGRGDGEQSEVFLVVGIEHRRERRGGTQGHRREQAQGQKETFDHGGKALSADRITRMDKISDGAFSGAYSRIPSFFHSV